MSRSGHSSLLRSLVMAVLLIVGSASLARAQGTVIVAFEIPLQPAVQVGGPVFLDVKIQNNSSDAVRVNMGHHGKWNFEFTIVNPDGTTTPVPPYRRFGPGPKGTAAVGPAQTLTRRLVFNEWHSFTRPGDYTIKVQLTVLLSSSANVSWQKEFFEDLKLRVGPRDPESLSRICGQLAATALGTDPAAAADAAFALSYIADPVAVPFLARVLQSGPAGARDHAIRGLARVGNPAARDVLTSSLATADADLKTKIESALSQFRPGS